MTCAVLLTFQLKTDHVSYSTTVYHFRPDLDTKSPSPCNPIRVQLLVQFTRTVRVHRTYQRSMVRDSGTMVVGGRGRVTVRVPSGDHLGIMTHGLGLHAALADIRGMAERRMEDGGWRLRYSVQWAKGGGRTRQGSRVQSEWVAENAVLSEKKTYSYDIHPTLATSGVGVGSKARVSYHGIVRILILVPGNSYIFARSELILPCFTAPHQSNQPSLQPCCPSPSQPSSRRASHKPIARTPAVLLSLLIQLPRRETAGRHRYAYAYSYAYAYLQDQYETRYQTTRTIQYQVSLAPARLYSLPCLLQLPAACRLLCYEYARPGCGSAYSMPGTWVEPCSCFALSPQQSDRLCMDQKHGVQYGVAEYSTDVQWCPGIPPHFSTLRPSSLAMALYRHTTTE